MKSIASRISLLALTMWLGAPAYAEEAAAPATATTPGVAADPADATDDGTIVVTASRIRGQIETNVPPIIEMDEAEIAAIGASSLEDLIAQLAPQTGSGRGRGGRPVFLVNGQRVSSFREMRRYPPEAIRKIEVFPEEVALQYGYPADQRVINFVLKDNFASREIEGDVGGPTAGGRTTVEGEASLLTINGPRRLSLGMDYDHGSMLTEAERGIIQTPGSEPTVATDPDPARYRSLVARNETVQFEGTWNTAFGEGAKAATLSINGNHNRASSTSWSGLDTMRLTSGTESALRTLDDNPLTTRRKTITTSIASTFNKPLGGWTLTVTGDGSHVRTSTAIDRRRDGQILQNMVDMGTLTIDGVLPPVPGVGRDYAVSKVTTATSLATLSGTPVRLPAGEMSVTFDSGYAWNRIASSDTRGAVGETVLKRGDLSGGVNVAIPLASAREGFLAPLGELGLNLGGGVDHLSDFGTLTDWTAGLNWRPANRLTLQASYTVRDVAPTLNNLGDPLIANYNVSTYDFLNSDTVLATVYTGGNSQLKKEKQRDIKLSASYDLDLFDRTNFLVEYYRNRSDDVTESFPLLTPAIEAAFPDRVRRDASGQLISVDQRPITFAERNSSRIRYGFNIFGRLGKASKRSEGGGGGRGATETPAATAVSPQPSTGAGARPGFDPARFAELRQRFCGENAQPVDVASLPERMQERLKGADGKVDPQRLTEFRTRLCSDNGAPGGFDPQRMEAVRQALCAGWKADDPNAPQPDLSALPERFRERLKGPDGQIDPARLAELRNRVCSMAAPSSADGGGGRPPAGPGPGGDGGPPRGGAGGGGPPAMPGFGRGGDGQGRWNLSLYHTIELKNDALIAPGVPKLDLLHGDALGVGGVSRHKVELEGGFFYKGMGMRLSGNYASKTRVDGSGLPGSSNLYFGDLATFNMRLFANLDQQEWLVGKNAGFWKGARVSIGVNNIFDAQQRVTDDTGTVPLRYQPGLIDPTGRTIEIDFRKIF